MLYQVPQENYKIHLIKMAVSEETFVREIDFYLSKKGQDYKCEVKLMGKGNPESADAVIARDSAIFIADKLSDTNKAQLNSLNVNWVELRGNNGYKRFKNLLDNLNIPYTDYNGDIDTDLPKIFAQIF